MAWIERCWLRLVLAVSGVAWLALVLAQLGRFHVELLAATLAAGAFGFALLRYALRSGPAPPRAERPSPRSLLGIGALLLLCAALFLPPHETVLSGGDATVYLNYGRQIARAGALEFEDELLGGLSPEARAALFENRRPATDATGPYARFLGGFQIPDVAEPVVTAGFSPLFPVLTALLHELAGLRGALFVAPLFATLGIGSLLLIAVRAGGQRAAWLAAALTLAALPQIWFARLPVPETTAQCLVLSGLLAGLRAAQEQSPRWALAAGWLLGLAGFAKVDLLVLLSVVLLAFVAWRLLAPPPRGALALPWLLAPFALLLVHNAVHYAAFASHYLPYVEYLLRTSALAALLPPPGPPRVAAAALAVLAVAAGIAFAVRAAAAVRRRAAGLAAAGLVAAYAANYALTTAGRTGETLVWLSWYVSWPVLLLAAGGAAWLAAARLRPRARRDEGWTLALLVFAVAGLHYLYDPLEPGVHIWAMRRFVPVVIPLAMLAASAGAAAALGRVGPRHRTVVTAGAALVLIGLVARPSLALVGVRPWDGGLTQTARLARRFPPAAVVLASPGLAGAHVATSLTYLHGVDAVLVQERNPPSAALRSAVRTWLAAGRPVFFVFGEQDHFSFFAPELALAGRGPALVELPLLEETPYGAPRETVRQPLRMEVFRLAERAASRTAVDVGDPAGDVFFALRGFHAPEHDGAADGTFRWSGADASLTVPGGDVRLTVGGGRPAGVPPAEISIWLNGHQVLERRVLADAPQTIRLHAPAAGADPVELAIRATAFEPRALGLSGDPRTLGVRVYRVEFGAG